MNTHSPARVAESATGRTIPMTRTVAARLPTEEGEFYLYHYTNAVDGKEHLALVCGDVRGGRSVPVRVHSECFTGDVLGSRRCDCGGQLHRAMQMIAAEGRGVIIYLRQEGRGIGLAAKLRAYNLQDEGYDTVEANLILGHQADEREYGAAAGILADLQIESINLLTNNPTKIEHLRRLGVLVEGRTPVIAAIHDDNRAYLETKVQRMSHLLDLPAVPGQAAHEQLAGAPADAVDRAVDWLVQSISRHQGRRPFVTLSYAQSLNGAIATAQGGSVLLSGDEAMRLTHRLRTLHQAILVGIRTVLADDPRLTARLVEGPQPQPVILDAHLRLPAGARVLQHPQAPLLAASAESDPERAALLARLGATVLPLPLTAPGRVDVAALLDALGERGIRSIMVEGGAQTIAEFLRLGLADAVVVTIAPRYLAGLPSVAQAASDLTAAALPALDEVRYTPLGSDLILWGALSRTP